ncbi:MAG: hypothetical protein RUDDFDWM_000011 [Candidatus Fervidibacterota bacterium]
MRNVKVAMTACAFLVFAICAFASAQVKGLDEVIEEAFDLQDATLQDAIDALFKDTGVNYMIDQRVQGMVTLKVKGLPRRRVLDLICERVGAEWVVEDGVVRIRPKQQPVPQQPVGPGFQPGGAPGQVPMPGQPVGPFPPGAVAPVRPEEQMAQMGGAQVGGRRTAPTVGGIQTAEEAEPEEYVWARIPLRFTDAIMVAEMLGGQVITPTGGTLGGGGGRGGFGGFGGLGGWGGGLGGFGGFGGLGGLGGWGGGLGGFGGFGGLGGLGGWGGGFGGFGGLGGLGGWGGGFGGLGGWGGGFGGFGGLGGLGGWGGFGGRGWGGWGGRGWRR